MSEMRLLVQLLGKHFFMAEQVTFLKPKVGVYGLLSQQ